MRVSFYGFAHKLGYLGNLCLRHRPTSVTAPFDPQPALAVNPVTTPLAAEEASPRGRDSS